MRTSAGSPGRPARAEAYSGTPTQVKSRGSSGSPSKVGTSLSTNVMPDAPAPSA